jgi:hypothetical protein
VPPAVIVVLFLLVPLVLTGAIIYGVHRWERKRVEEMRPVARAMGFAFEEKLAGAADEVFGALPLLSRGHSRRTSSVMRGELAGEPAVVFDYRYTVGSGKNSNTCRQTVALFPTRGRDLPDFELGPENFLHRIGQVFGYQDIDFEQDDVFSKAYLLRGENEAAIKRTFSSTVRSLLVQEPGWSIQSRGDAVAVFKSRKRCQPLEAPAFLASALRIASTLKS